MAIAFRVAPSSQQSGGRANVGHSALDQYSEAEFKPSGLFDLSVLAILNLAVKHVQNRGGRVVGLC